VVRIEVKEALMTKRDQAFELFSQGKKLGDPELEALGLKKESKRRYFREWKKTEAEPIVEAAPPVVVVAPPVMVRASSLKSGDKFEFNGEIYRAGKSQSCVLGANLTQPRAPVLTVGLNAMVKPVR